jgi:hypothetical protein
MLQEADLGCLSPSSIRHTALGGSIDHPIQVGIGKCLVSGANIIRHPPRLHASEVVWAQLRQLSLLPEG